MTTLNRRIVLASRPSGAASEANFRLESVPVPEPGPGQVLVRHHYLSLDPYMRGRMNEQKSYAAPQPLDAVMIGGTVGAVVASRHPGFAVGDSVVNSGGWQEYAVADGADAAALRKVDASRIPLSAYLGAVGMPGVTAWYGLNIICEPKAGETVAVSAASGAVGGIVGQLAKAKGCRVVGIAGGAEKCGYVVRELGFDACIDYKTAPDAKAFGALLHAAAPQGIDGYFENVGGMLILMSRLKVQGFIVSEHPGIWPKALAELGSGVASGAIKYRESVSAGLESAPSAFLGLLKGRNFGKQLVKLI